MEPICYCGHHRTEHLTTGKCVGTGSQDCPCTWYEPMPQRSWP